ncbi:dTMP kinase [Kineosporia sp. NBRC 101731]|uniref:dTMP kinase n=1 Tax=Kineosporia sp. NBRC 101731 TaxID=3032199 RepID=UPI0024A4F8E7|nr:dTMP kinase [Kineosporia sp. NBRC 101731]GLY31070.1 hypothetical protein Kisp02_44350 [Kineosporia sp. NBRC 101731]
MTASGQHENGRREAGPSHTGVPDQHHDVAAEPFRRLRPALGGSSFADWLALLAVIAAAGTLTDGSYAKTNLAVAGVLALRLTPAVLLGPVAGALTDRTSRKVVMIAADVLRAAVIVSIPLIGSLAWLYVATVLLGGLALLWTSAAGAAVAALTPADRRPYLVITYGTAPVAALVFSGLSLLSGVLDNAVDRLGTHPVDLALYACALAFVVAGGLASRAPIPGRRPGETAEQESVIRSITTGRQLIGSVPVARGLVSGLLGAFAAAGFVLGLSPTYVHDLGAGRPGYGVLFAAVFLGLALGLAAGSRRPDGLSPFRLFGLSLIGAGLFLATIALIPNMVMAALLAVGLGACGGIAWNTGHTLLGLAVDDSVRTRTFNFLAAASRVVLLLVLALGPVLAAVIGRHTIHFTDSRVLSYNGAAFVFLIAAVLVVALGVAAYRRLDDRPGTGLLQDLRSLRSSRSPRPVAPQPAYPGVFVALEGGDGSGKSTQARLLGDWLRSDQGHDVVLTREPGATPAGVRLREVLLSNASDLGNRAEALLFAADRAHHVEAVVRPALQRGAVVVTDRYIDSSVAYQGAGRELDGEEVLRLSQWATDDLVPALTVLLDVDPVISKVRRTRDASRGGEDRLESLADDFHDRVRAEFLALARRAPHRYLVVDAGLGADQVQQLIRERVRQVLPVSARRRAELNERLADEDQSRERRAAAEAEVLRMDADLRRRRVEEAREREESRRRARDEAERQLQEEAERELRAQESRRNREEVDRRASEAAAAAALGPVTEPVQMPGRYPGRRPVEPPTDPLTGHLPVQEPEQEPIQESFEPQEQDLWAPPADLTQPVQTPRPQPYETFESYEGQTNPVPQGPPPEPVEPVEPLEPRYQPEQDLQAPPRTIHLPDEDPADDRTIVLPDSENNPETGPLRRRGRRQA